MSSRPMKASFWLETKYIIKSIMTELMSRKLATALTILVIAVALILPIMSYLFWKNTQQTIAQAYPETTITAYLENNLTNSQIEDLLTKIKQNTQIQSLNYISSEQGLQDFKQWSGFEHELALLKNNPLPPAVVLDINRELRDSPEELAKLKDQLLSIKGINQVNIDSQMINHLNTITHFIYRLSIVFTILMLLSVILTIGNSIRSDIYSKRSTIRVMQLLGATDYFILRPFIYTGFLLGVFGALLALITATLIVAIFSSMIANIAQQLFLTHQDETFNLIEFIFIICITGLVGWISAWISAKKHINQLD